MPSPLIICAVAEFQLSTAAKMKSSSKLKILISFVIISTCIQYSLTQDYPGVDDYPGDYSEGGYRRYTANVYRDREIRVRGFQIYGDCM